MRASNLKVIHLKNRRLSYLTKEADQGTLDSMVYLGDSFSSSLARTTAGSQSNAASEITLENIQTTCIAAGCLLTDIRSLTDEAVQVREVLDWVEELKRSIDDSREQSLEDQLICRELIEEVEGRSIMRYEKLMRAINDIKTDVKMIKSQRIARRDLERKDSYVLLYSLAASDQLLILFAMIYDIQRRERDGGVMNYDYLKAQFDIQLRHCIRPYFRIHSSQSHTTAVSLSPSHTVNILWSKI